MAYTEIANVADLEEGKGKRVEVNGQIVALFKINGQVFALGDTCAHAGGPLSDGAIQDNCVICPWHNFDYDLKTGQSSRGCKVPTFPIKIENNKVLLDI